MPNYSNIKIPNTFLNIIHFWIDVRLLFCFHSGKKEQHMRSQQHFVTQFFLCLLLSFLESLKEKTRKYKEYNEQIKAVGLAGLYYSPRNLNILIWRCKKEFKMEKSASVRNRQSYCVLQKEEKNFVWISCDSFLVSDCIFYS